VLCKPSREAAVLVKNNGDKKILLFVTIRADCASGMVREATLKPIVTAPLVAEFLQRIMQMDHSG
jgi:hypothetical protein